MTKEAWDAPKVMFDASDNTQLLRLMDELSSLKKGSDENIILYTSRAKIIRDELAMLGNPEDDNTLAPCVLSRLPTEYGTLRTVLENKDSELVMADVTAKLLPVEQRIGSGGSAKPADGLKAQALAAAAAKKPWFKKSVVCFYCEKKGHKKGDGFKRKADAAKNKGKPDGGSRHSGKGGGPHSGAALAFSAVVKNVGRRPDCRGWMSGQCQGT